MAPEIINNWRVGRTGETYEGASFTEVADCFSLAVVVWECLTGCAPYMLNPPTDTQGYKLWGPGLGDAIVNGLRPGEDEFEDGDGGVVSHQIRDMIAASWDVDPDHRLPALQMERMLRSHNAKSFPVAV